MGTVRYGLPAGYRRLEYLNSNGNQYIDTQIYNFESFILDYKSTGGSYWNNILGYIPTGCTRRFAATSGQYVAVFHPDSYYIWANFDINSKVRNRLEYSLAAGRSYVVNGETYSGLSAVAVNTAYDVQDVDLSVYLFASNLGTSLSYGYAAIYSCTMRDNKGVKVRDFIPALDPTGAPCMFDLVSRKPFYNSGTGDFSYPKMQQATTYSLRRRDYAMMTEHGIRRLYHVPNGCTLSKEDYAEQNGFKLLVETPAPEEGYWTPIWHDREDYIELEWVETAPPEESLTE